MARSREATSLPPYNITKQWNVLQLLLPYHIKLHILRIVRLQPILLQYIAVRQKCLDFQVCIKFKVCIHFLEIAVIEIKCTIASRCCHCLSSLCVGTLGSIIQSNVGQNPVYYWSTTHTGTTLSQLSYQNHAKPIITANVMPANILWFTVFRNLPLCCVLTWS